MELKRTNKKEFLINFIEFQKETLMKKGFGIGLYYTEKIIEKHGGQIKVISNFENTTFKLVLPNE